MSFLIAVDDSLSNIRDALRNQGYQTVELSMADFRDVDAYVVDKNNEDLTKRKNTIADEWLLLPVIQMLIWLLIHLGKN